MPDSFQFALSWDIVARILTITLIDLALSGDNAIVIGMAAASLPRRQRPWAIAGGAGLAIVLRISITAVATLLMMIPLLSAAGGCVLFWIAWRLLSIDTAATEGDDGKGHGAATLREAILIIVAADVTMSIDNVIAVAGSAHGNIALLFFGLLVSIPLLMTTGGFISVLIARFKGLVYLGAGAICLTGMRMILEDSVVDGHLKLPELTSLAIGLATGIAVPLTFIAINRRRAATP